MLYLSRDLQLYQGYNILGHLSQSESTTILNFKTPREGATELARA